MQIHFHSLLWSYLPRVLISLAVTVYLCICGYDSQVWFCWEFSDWISNRLTSLIIKIRERLIISGDTGNGSCLSVCSQLQWLRPDRSPRQARWPLTERRQERRPPSSQTVQCPLTSSPTQPVSGAFTNTPAKGCFNNQNHVLAYCLFRSIQYGFCAQYADLLYVLSMHIHYICQTEHTARNTVSHNAMHLGWPSISSKAKVLYYLFKVEALLLINMQVFDNWMPLVYWMSKNSQSD